MAQLYSFHAAMAIEHARLTEQLTLQAIRDGKTGLFNHDHFRECFVLEMDRTVRQDHQMSLLMADIDNYKLYNDTYGHLRGDRALTIIGSTFRRIARQTDIAARYGGEEFVVLLPDTDLDGAIIIAERIRAEIAEELFPGHDGAFDARLTLSIGASSYPEDGDNIDALIEAADIGLYGAKGSGRLTRPADLKKTVRRTTGGGYSARPIVLIMARNASPSSVAEASMMSPDDASMAGSLPQSNTWITTSVGCPSAPSRGQTIVTTS
jgi:diguanylate cyclase (GGDEF)-like protein